MNPSNFPRLLGLFRLYSNALKCPSSFIQTTSATATTVDFNNRHPQTPNHRTPRSHQLLEGELSNMAFPGTLREGRGYVIPTRFEDPNQQEQSGPDEQFPPSIAIRTTPMIHRFIHRDDDRRFLIYTAASDRGRFIQSPRAGCGFVFAPTFTGNPMGGSASFLVEARGPTGELFMPTYERACIRAVIGALRAKNWVAEGFSRIVIATNSPFIAYGATQFIVNWIRYNWVNQAGDPVKHADLWLCLLGEVEKWYERGLRIQFWLIPRMCNSEAENLAIQAMEMDWPTPPEFTDDIPMCG